MRCNGAAYLAQKFSSPIATSLWYSGNVPTPTTRSGGLKGRGKSVTAFKSTLQIIILAAFAHITPAQAQIDSRLINDDLAAASRSINEGHVKEGCGRLIALLNHVDPVNDGDNYWRVSATLVEFLSQIEDHANAAEWLTKIVSTKIPETQPVYKQWMQFYIGRNLAYTGHPNEGEQFLRALTGGDARLVLVPVQRAAAIMLSKIEYDRGNKLLKRRFGCAEP